MQAQTTFTDAGWDFIDETANGTDDIWNIDGTNNNGYPYFNWQFAPTFLDAPQNVIISLSLSDVTITWDAVAGATSYQVYSSAEPYSGFEEDTSGTFISESWSVPIIDAKKFYYVIAVY